jgi:hypothetical protein
MSAPRRILKIEREARFEAARGVMLSRLEGGTRDDGWFKGPGVVGRYLGRDVELRFSGGGDCRVVRAAIRIRTGGAFRARSRSRVFSFFWGGYRVLRGSAPPEGVPFALESLLRDFGALRIDAGDGRVTAQLRWDPAVPDPDRLLKVLDRLHRVALALEDVRAPLVESGGALLCPFCHEFIGDAEPLARCDSCGTPFHPSCFEENRGCMVYGCSNRSARTSSGRYPALEPESKSLGKP